MSVADMVAYGRLALVTSMFDVNVDVLTPVVTRDARGAAKESWDAPGVLTVTGRVMQPGAADRREVEDVNIAATAYVIGLPYGTAVTAHNRLRVSGRTYVVLRAFTEGSQVLYVRCLCYLT